MAQGKGLFSAIGGYVQGMGLGARGVGASMLTRGGQAGYNAGQLARHGAMSAAGSRLGTAAGNWGKLGMYGLSRAGGTGIGALAGAAYGGMSDDTSVLCGAMMGAGLGRYGGAGLRRAARGGAGMGFGAHSLHAAKGFGRGAWGQMRADFRGMK